MRERSSPPSSRSGTAGVALSVDVVLLAPLQRQLSILLVRARAPRARERWELPWASAQRGQALDQIAHRVAAQALGRAPAWLEQVGAFSAKRHPSESDVSVAFYGLLAEAVTGAEPRSAWIPADDLPALAPRQGDIVRAALRQVRERMDQAPIAFHLLPPTFTLTQLQEVYELLLGRRLHKASFRRALHAAWLVEPTDEWRSEGRGRPAQLFRYAPRKRRSVHRGVRFEGLAG
ncbi:MAG TPA: hypothetical protein VFK13_05645 [Gemmatimonadaceae bacterium]|nr:hypothetical protein [Gemmatimonadaceae bacterium]